MTEEDLARVAGLPQPDQQSELPRLSPALSENWQPIETAPKDGTRILCYLPPNGRMGFWPCILFWGCDDAGDCEQWIDVDDFAPDPQPTHWMPLPSPPDSSV